MADEYHIELTEDRPLRGMWHCGPNAAWVTVTHLPTMISARAFDQNHWDAKRAAEACCQMMVEQSRLLKCQFPERLAQGMSAGTAKTPKEVEAEGRQPGPATQDAP